MFTGVRKIVTTGLLVVFILTGCSDFNQIIKSSDYEAKYRKAIEYYEAGEYSRATVLLNELVNIYRGTSRADDIYYYSGKSSFAVRDYLMAGHWFRTLVKEFPRSEFVEESQFMIGYCYYHESPRARLDQQVTQKAIDALQLYVNLFPMAENVEEAGRLINELREKLVYKSYLTGRLYYDLEHYRASVIALSNSLNEFPDTKYREDLMFMLLDSKYHLAMMSTEDKKQQRLSDALDEYFSFIDEFPDSKHRKSADRFYDVTSELLHYEQ